MNRMFRLGTAASATLLLAGCASVGIDDALKESNERAPQFTQGQLELSRTPDSRDRRAALADELLSKPLTQDEAVRRVVAKSNV